MTHSEEPQANKLVFWVLGSVFAVAMLLTNVVFTMRTSKVDAIEETANEAKEMGTINNTKIEYITRQVDSMNLKLDRLLESRGVSIIPKPAT